MTQFAVKPFIQTLKRLHIERKGAIPILNFAYAHGNTLESTDLHMWTIATLPASVPSPCLIPVKNALDVLNGEDGNLSLISEGSEPLEKLERIAEYLEARNETDSLGIINQAKKEIPYSVKLALDSCEYSLNSTSPRNFPQCPPIPETLITVKASQFLELLERTIFAVSKEESRYTLNGLLLESDQKGIRLIGTDGHRLSLAEIPGEFPALSTLITLDAAEWLRKNLKGCETVEIGTALWCNDSPTKLNSFRLPDIGMVAISRALTGNFPNYRAIMPTDLPITGNIPDSMEKTLARVSKMADERSGCVQFQVDDSGITLSAQNTETGKAVALVPSSFNGSAKIGLSSAYVLEFIKRAENVVFSIKSGESAVKFSTDNWTYILMPMRI